MMLKDEGEGSCFYTSLEFERKAVTYSSYAIFATATFVFVLLGWLKIPAPYGRYHNDKTVRVQGLYAVLDTKVPGRFGWIIMESPNVIIPLLMIFMVHPESTINLPNAVLLSIYEFHYVYRSFVFPFLQTQKPHTVITFLSACFFCSLNAYCQAVSLLRLSHYQAEWLLTPNFCIGVFLFCFGLFINMQSDYILRNLRKPGETGYKIPRGGMFEFVSGANFFGEIIEWCGYALACSNLAGCAFAFFTLCNIGPRAMSHHSYYLSKFEDYPKDRKAIIPFIL